MTRLNQARDAEIVALHFGGRTDEEIAKKYGISKERVRFIVRRSPQGRAEYIRYRECRDLAAKERGRERRRIAAEREAARLLAFNERQEQILRWHDDGQNVEWIGAKLGVTPPYALQLLKRALGKRGLANG